MLLKDTRRLIYSLLNLLNEVNLTLVTWFRIAFTMEVLFLGYIRMKTVQVYYKLYIFGPCYFPNLNFPIFVKCLSYL